MPNVAFAIGVMSMKSATELVASYFEPQPGNPSRASWTASVLAILIFLNLLAVVLESIDGVNNRFATEFFLFECFSIFFFTVEYIAMYSTVKKKIEKHSNKKNSVANLLFTPSIDSNTTAKRFRNIKIASTDAVQLARLGLPG